IPQIAMSAGTLIACSCKEIIMGSHSNIGPVDRQVYGFPAYAVRNEIATAYNEIKGDPNKAQEWYAILSKYTPGFVQLCQWAEENSTELAERFLKENMFNDVPFPEQEAVVSAIVDRLTDLSKNKSHDKHIHIDDCLSMGLRIVRLEDSKNK